MDVEAVLLTGGASRRMGIDKGKILFNGRPLAEAIAGELLQVAKSVTVLGQHPIAGCAFLKDESTFAGPRVALQAFEPTSELVFVASCDIPLFQARVVTAFCARIGARDALVPLLGGRLQPLCALYRASAFDVLRRELEDRRLLDWLAQLDVGQVDEARLRAWSVDPNWVRGVNTAEEFRALARGYGA